MSCPHLPTALPVLTALLSLLSFSSPLRNHFLFCISPNLSREPPYMLGTFFSSSVLQDLSYAPIPSEHIFLPGIFLEMMVLESMLILDGLLKSIKLLKISKINGINSLVLSPVINAHFLSKDTVLSTVCWCKFAIDFENIRLYAFCFLLLLGWNTILACCQCLQLHPLLEKCPY